MLSICWSNKNKKPTTENVFFFGCWLHSISFHFWCLVQKKIISINFCVYFQAIIHYFNQYSTFICIFIYWLYFHCLISSIVSVQLSCFILNYILFIVLPIEQTYLCRAFHHSPDLAHSLFIFRNINSKKMHSEIRVNKKNSISVSFWFILFFLLFSLL